MVHLTTPRTSCTRLVHCMQRQSSIESSGMMARHVPDFEVERAVDAVLLCSKDGGKMLSHDAALSALPETPWPLQISRRKWLLSGTPLVAKKAASWGNHTVFPCGELHRRVAPRPGRRRYFKCMFQTSVMGQTAYAQRADRVSKRRLANEASVKFTPLREARENVLERPALAKS